MAGVFLAGQVPPPRKLEQQTVIVCHVHRPSSFRMCVFVCVCARAGAKTLKIVMCMLSFGISEGTHPFRLFVHALCRCNVLYCVCMI